LHLKSYIVKCRSEKSLDKCRETNLGHYLFHIGIKSNFSIFEKKFNMTSKEIIFKTLQSNKLELKKHGIRNVGLFGSYIRNEQSSESDIDLLIDFEPEKENFDNYMAVYDLFEKIFKNEKIEVVTKNGLSPYIGPKILKEVQYA
jgi:predicted nucleotidyltransferase